MAEQTLTLPDQPNTDSGTEHAGPRIHTSGAGKKIVRIIKDADCTATNVSVYLRTGVGVGTIVNSGAFSGNTATFDAELTEGEDYYIVPHASGSSFTNSEYRSASFPYNGVDINAIASNTFVGAADYTDYVENIYQIVTNDASTDATVTPSTLTLTTTADAPTINVIIIPSSDLPLSIQNSMVNILGVLGPVYSTATGPGTIGSKVIKSDYYITQEAAAKETDEENMLVGVAF